MLRRRAACYGLSVVTGMCSAPAEETGSNPMPEPGRTWIEIEGRIVGAKPDGRGRIGGGTGFDEIVTDGQYRVATVDELVAGLSQARPGETVFI